MTDKAEPMDGAYRVGSDEPIDCGLPANNNNTISGQSSKRRSLIWPGSPTQELETCSSQNFMKQHGSSQNDANMGQKIKVEVIQRPRQERERGPNKEPRSDLTWPEPLICCSVTILVSRHELRHCTFVGQHHRLSPKPFHERYVGLFYGGCLIAENHILEITSWLSTPMK